MKYVWLQIRLLLFVGAIVLLGLSMWGNEESAGWMLCGGMLCSAAGLWLNIWLQRRDRQGKQ